MMTFIAHKRASDDEKQTVATHLFEARDFAQTSAAKIGLGEAGGLIGLLHDFGKYSEEFQHYIQSATKMINPDDDRYVDAKGMKGQIDHSTAGAQWVMQAIFSYKNKRQLSNEQSKQLYAAGQILALCIASHHSGLIDCLAEQIGPGFTKRLKKSEADAHFQQCMAKADESVLSAAGQLVESGVFETLLAKLATLQSAQQNGHSVSAQSQAFYVGMLTRFMFSCLIDADRISSADFETPENKLARSNERPDWHEACARVESFIAELPVRSDIDTIRQAISNECKARALDAQGIYFLTVPTGGGKTYSSIRYAVHHAKKHQLDRIIYIIPYTSIIDQNADEIRKALKQTDDERPWVLEHHSNLEPERQTWHNKLTSENWDAPIVLTTMVQFLESLFAGGTRGVRKLHQMANSVIVFDEIQNLPINCVHLFCNAINFMADHCNTTAVMCTATQPLLHQLPDPTHGQLHMAPNHELMSDVSQRFAELKRVNIIDETKPNGWSLDEISDLALSQVQQKSSCLVIVNTKNWACALYQSCVEQQQFDEDQIFHLSTAQYPAHRKAILKLIRQRLADGLPTLCISTQLIEAGVDVSFSAVIRFLAGLDSIAQAAGGCNRNKEAESADVLVINPDKENIDTLVDIKIGIDITKDIFDKYKGQDLLAPEVMRRYFDMFFYQRYSRNKKELCYPVDASKDNASNNLLNWLAENEDHPNGNVSLPLKQAFMSAGKAFKAIDAPTQPIIVEHGKGADIVTQLCQTCRRFDAKEYSNLIKQAQQYSVNVFPNVWQKLLAADAVVEIGALQSEPEGIYYLKSDYYSESFGVGTEPVGEMNFYDI